MNKKCTQQYDKRFFENTTPSKLTEARRLKLHAKYWGILTDYNLESVKINNYKPGMRSTTAIIRLCDKSGQTTCIIRGTLVSKLFGVAPEEWSEVENLCPYKQQLFYRYFKEGLSENYKFEQKLFYNFCASSQKKETFVIVFYRCPNNRNKDKDDALIEILDIQKCSDYALDLYVSHLRQMCADKPI